MSADTIIKRILNESKDECAAIETDAKERAKKLVEEAKAKAALDIADIEKKNAADCEEAKRRRLQIADLDGRKMELAAKRSVLDEAFEKALEKLKTLEQGAWEKLMIARMVAGAQTGEEKLLVRAEDEQRFAALLGEANKALKAAGKAGNVSIGATDAKFAGGFALEGVNTQVNSSYEVMLREVREEAERDIAQMLFSLEV